MAQVLWRTGNWNGINTDTVTSINTLCPNSDGSNAGQSAGGKAILGCWSDPIPRNKRYQWEITVSGGCSSSPQGIFTYTAFTMGIAIAGISSDKFSNFSKLSTSGGTQPNPSGPYTFADFSYNKSMTIGNNNGGYIVAAAPGNPANTIFRNGSIVTIDFDDVNHRIQFYVDGQAQWGSFNTSGFDSRTLYVNLQTWSGGRPVAKLNDGTHPLVHPVNGVQTLQQAIGGGVIITPPPPVTDPNAITHITTTVIPAAVTANVAYSIQGVADQPFAVASDVFWSSQLSTAAQSFINSASGVTVTLSSDKKTATISGLLSGTTQPHTAYVRDGKSGTTSAGTPYTVTAATTQPPPVGVGENTWLTTGGFQPSVFTFSNGNKTIHRAQSSAANLWSTVVSSGVCPQGARTYFEVDVTGGVTGTATIVLALWSAGGFYVDPLNSTNTIPRYRVSATYNGSTTITDNTVDTYPTNPRQWNGNTQPPGWQLTPGNGLESFTYIDSSGNVHLGYATINTGLPLAIRNTQAHVVWGGDAGLTTTVGFLLDLVNYQVSYVFRVLSTGFQTALGPFSISFQHPLTPSFQCQTAFLLPGGLTATLNGGTAGFKIGLPSGYAALDSGFTPPAPTPTVILVDNPAFGFSPENWYGSTGRA